MLCIPHSPVSLSSEKWRVRDWKDGGKTNRHRSNSWGLFHQCEPHWRHPCTVANPHRPASATPTSGRGGAVECSIGPQSFLQISPVVTFSCGVDDGWQVLFLGFGAWLGIGGVQRASRNEAVNSTDSGQARQASSPRFLHSIYQKVHLACQWKYHKFSIKTNQYVRTKIITILKTIINESTS